jgi:hypothetical protein
MPDERLDLLARLPHQQELIFVLRVRISSIDSEKHLLASKPEVRWYYILKEAINNSAFLQVKDKITFSINLPIPVAVRARPPKTWVASVIERSC